MFLFNVFVENAVSFHAMTKKSILPDCHRPLSRQKSSGISMNNAYATLPAMNLVWRMTNIQVFLVTQLCQHFLFAIVMGFSFIETC